MADRIQFRRDTKERWASINPILMEGEIGLETDTQHQKIGDGVNAWNNLEYTIGVGNITNETGYSENLAASQKLVTETLRKGGTDLLFQSTGDGCYVTDEDLRVGLQYTSTDGFDVAKLSSHFVEIAKNAGLGGGGTDLLFQSTEDGFHVTDENLNVGMKYTSAEGLDAAKLSSHFVDVAKAAGLGGGGTIGEAPSDGYIYGRKNAAWEKITSQSSTDAESVNNKVTEISANSTDTQYPSAKAVYNAINEYPSEGTEFTYYGGKISLETEAPRKAVVRSFFKDVYLSYFGLHTWNGGLAIYNDIALLSFNQGYIVILQWSTKSVLATGKLASYGTTNHANNISFGTSFYNNNSLPLLYISETYETSSVGTKKCYVENVAYNTSTKTVTCTNVQTITYTGSKLQKLKTCDWAVDRKTGYLYGYGYDATTSYAYNHTQLVIMKFNLPSTSLSSVTLSDSDVIESKITTYGGVLQGASVYNNIFATAYSANVTGGCTDVGVHLFDYQNAKVLFDKSLWSVTHNELEGCCFYNGKIYVTGVYDSAAVEFLELTF